MRSPHWRTSLIARAVVLPCGLLALLLALAIPFAPVSAHSELISSDPEPGEVLETAPSQIVLNFSEPLGEGSSVIVYTVEYLRLPGVTYSIDPTMPTRLTAQLPELQPGAYAVQWRSISLDGHELTGNFSFEIGSRLPLAEMGVFAWLSLIGVVIAGGFFLARRRRS
jgi:methionine-rich copper-binding protein CopC